MDFTAERRYVIDYSDFIHTISTGIFSYKKSPNKWWKLWSLYNIVAASSIFLGSISYIITDNLSSKELACLSMSILCSIVIVTVQKISYKFSENWNKLKGIVGKDFVGSLDNSGALRHNERVNNLRPWFEQTFIRIFAVFVKSIVVIIMGSFLWQCFRPDVDFGDKLNYFYLFHDFHRVNSRATFLLVYAFQSISCIAFVCTWCSKWLLYNIFVAEMSNMRTALEERMKSISEDVHRDIASIRDYEMKNDMKKSPAFVKLVQQKSQNDRKICFQKFEENLKICIRHHQIILRSIKLIKPSLDSFFTVNLALLVLLMIAAGFSITSEKELTFDPYMMKLLLTFLGSLFATGFGCVIAQRLQDMNDRIAEQVYSLPWYELTPPFRKIVYIFLCQAQAPIKFYAFNTFRFSTFFFPTVVNYVYTNTVNLLTIYTKHHRN